MEVSESEIRKGLEPIAEGGSWDYSPVSGGIVIFNKKGEIVEQKTEIQTFLSLRAKGFIDMKQEDTKYNWHPIFRPSFQNPVDIYKITPKGLDYLKSPQVLI